MNKLDVSSGISKRLEAFIGSDLFSTQSSFSKSAYWRQHADLLKYECRGNNVEVSGCSGFYVPQLASVLKSTANKISNAIKQPSLIVPWLQRLVDSRFGVPRLMSYEKAFDAVMSCVDVSVPILSPYAIDHRKLAQESSHVFTSTVSIKRHYQSWSGYEASSNIILHHYYQNILHGFVDKNQINTIQEMIHEQIDIYFKIIKRVCRESGFFFISNRLEKIPYGADAFSVEQLDPPNRFAEYP
jgi:hypothetical protein